MENLEGKLEYGDRVEELAGAGATEDDIAAELSIAVDDLRERYRDALAHGNAKGKNDVLVSFHKQVQSGTNFSSASMWIKARCGWRETGVVVGSSDNRPLVEIVLTEPK